MQHKMKQNNNINMVSLQFIRLFKWSKTAETHNFSAEE